MRLNGTLAGIVAHFKRRLASLEALGMGSESMPGLHAWSPRACVRTHLIGTFLAVWMASGTPAWAQRPGQLRRPEKPLQRDRPQVGLQLIESSRFIRVVEARNDFSVDGTGLTVAVLDTGLRTTHVDFSRGGRVAAQVNFTADNGGDRNDVTDGDGHGTNVGGIVVASGVHTGIAPGARIIPLKVLSNDGRGSLQAVADALQWVIDHQTEYNIRVVNMSLGDDGNYENASQFGADDAIRDRINTLSERRVAVIAPAGNGFYNANSVQGMSYPGIFPRTISVGAVYDSDIGGPIVYPSGAIAYRTSANQITPFSQRLHEAVNGEHRTDIFAPGAPVTSSGINGDQGESVQHGTSQAAPVTAGVVLLLQQFYHRSKGEWPTVDQIITWLRRSNEPITDATENENDPGRRDNVQNTGRTFVRLDALNALLAAQRDIQVSALKANGILKDAR